MTLRKLIGTLAALLNVDAGMLVLYAGDQTWVSLSMLAVTMAVTALVIYSAGRLWLIERELARAKRELAELKREW